MSQHGFQPQEGFPPSSGPISQDPFQPQPQPPVADSYQQQVQLGEKRRQNGTYKRLVVFCDGTGQQSDGTKDLPVSNVTRFCRNIAHSETIEGKEIAQVVFYQNGVGTGSLTLLSEMYAGATGWGLNENVCEAYLWLKSNYVEGDEIFLFGFSRGAYTARAIGGLIAHIGILDKGANFQQVYNGYQERGSNFGGDEHQGGFRSTKKIKAIGVWDTVGSLGVPDRPADRTYAFHDTTISPNVENAFHALALDEHRGSFYPTLWTLPPSDKEIKTNLKQCWFPGVHSDVGGSYADAEPHDFSDIALAWMVDQCRGLLAFDEPYARGFFEPALDKEKRSLWAAQPIHNSMTGVFKAGSVRYRAPGEYEDLDPFTGKPVVAGPTNESIHPSVRMRLLKSHDFKLGWRLVAMNDFRLVRTASQDGWEWVKTVEQEGGARREIRIPEYKIEEGSWESRLMTKEDKEMLEDVRLSDRLGRVKRQCSWLYDRFW